MKLTQLKYVSDTREKQFAKLGARSVEELVKLFPRAYLDLTKVNSITELRHNAYALVDCEVLSVEVNNYSRRPYVKALCKQGDNFFQTIWFNQPYVAQKLKSGEYLFYGRVQNRYGLKATKRMKRQTVWKPLKCVGTPISTSS